MTRRPERDRVPSPQFCLNTHPTKCSALINKGVAAFSTVGEVWPRPPSLSPHTLHRAFIIFLARCTLPSVGARTLTAAFFVPPFGGNESRNNGPPPRTRSGTNLHLANEPKLTTLGRSASLRTSPPPRTTTLSSNLTFVSTYQAHRRNKHLLCQKCRATHTRT